MIDQAGDGPNLTEERGSKMAKLLCLCGEILSTVGDRNEVEGFLLIWREIDFFDRTKGELRLEVDGEGRDVWECPDCGRLAVSYPGRKDSTVKWYAPVNEKPGHLFAESNS